MIEPMNECTDKVDIIMRLYNSLTLEEMIRVEEYAKRDILKNRKK